MMSHNTWRQLDYTEDVIECKLTNQVGFGNIAQWHPQYKGSTVRLVVLNNGDQIYLRGIREVYVFLRALESATEKGA